MATRLKKKLIREVRKGRAGTKVKSTPAVATRAKEALEAGVPIKKVQRQVERGLATTVTTTVDTGRKKPGKGLRRSGKVEKLAKRVRRRLKPKRSVR